MLILNSFLLLNPNPLDIPKGKHNFVMLCLLVNITLFFHVCESICFVNKFICIMDTGAWWAAFHVTQRVGHD